MIVRTLTESYEVSASLTDTVRAEQIVLGVFASEEISPVVEELEEETLRKIAGVALSNVHERTPTIGPDEEEAIARFAELVLAE